MFHKISFLNAALIPMSVLCAQTNPATPRPPASVTAPGQTSAKAEQGSPEGDKVLAAWLLSTNANEVALSKVALQRALSPEVRQFAQKMVDDHGEMIRTLQALPSAPPTAGHSSKATAAETGSQRVSPVTSSVTAPNFDHSALINDLGKKCLETASKMLGEKSGVDFDRCYMQMQVAAHIQAADMMEVFLGHATEALRPSLQAGHKTVVAHLEHAKTLAKQAEGTAKTSETAHKIGGPGGR